jgi:hypothetical protein
LIDLRLDLLLVTCSGYSSLYLHGLTKKGDLQKREGIGKKEKEKREKEKDDLIKNVCRF